MLDFATLNKLRALFVTKDRTSYVDADIHPSTHDTYDLGETDQRWDNIYAASVIADNLSGSPGFDHGALGGLSDDDHSIYMHITNARTVTAQHTLNPSGAPFVIGVNAEDQFVDGLNADQLDSLEAAAFLSPTYVTMSTDTNLTNERVLTAGDGLSLTDGGGGSPATLDVGVSGLGLSVDASDVILTSSSNPGADTAAILASDASGYLRLIGLGIGTSATADDQINIAVGGVVTFVGAGTINTGAGNLSLSPAGDVVLNPTGAEVLPGTGYTVNLGALNNKFLELHAAELVVETLVAQNTIATIGGRILVGPTTTLVEDLSAGTTVIKVKHNQISDGDRAYLEANSNVEFIGILDYDIIGVDTSLETFTVQGDITAIVPDGTKFTVDGSTGNDGEWTVSSTVFSTPNTVITVTGDITDATVDGAIIYFGAQSGTEFLYKVSRNLDGSGSDAWKAGDALFNTGTTGDGFIDLYSTSGMLSGTGPTIVGNVRTGSAYDAIEERWAIGNLNGLYGKVADTYGSAFGDYSGGNYLIAEVNGLELYTGDGLVIMDTNGISITPTTSYADKRSYQFKSGSTVVSQMRAFTDSGNNYIQVKANAKTNAHGLAYLVAESNTAGKNAISELSANGSVYNVSVSAQASDTLSYISLNALRVASLLHMEVAGGLWVGTTGGATANDIRADGDVAVDGGIYAGDATGEPADGDVEAEGDIFTTAFTDYTSTSTIVGWSSYTNQDIWYKKVGNLVFVMFNIYGTSDTTTVTFTLPHTSNAGVGNQFQFRAQDNTSNWTTGLGALPPSSSTVTLYTDNATTGWTASGTKGIYGQFFYET